MNTDSDSIPAVDAGGQEAVAPWPPELRSALLQAVRERSSAGKPTSTLLTSVHPNSAFPTFKATLSFSNGAEERWFVKDLGHRARWVQEPLRHRECEVAVYRHLLNGAPLGTPDLLCDCVGAGGSHWLVLEYVEGTPLKWLGLDWWVSAVRWLAKKDAHFRSRQQSVATQQPLNRLDEAHFRVIGGQAQAALRQLAPSMTPRLEGVVRYYLGIIEDLVWGDWTLVHGSYRPGQILVRASADHPVRICPVDWETAGHGSCICDVASLCEGFVGDRLDRLVGAYRESARESGAAVPSAADLLRTMHAHWIHRQLKLVIKSVHRGWAEHVARFVEAAELRAKQHRSLT